MPAIEWQDTDAPGKPIKKGYAQPHAHHWTCTDVGLETARQIRREEAKDELWWKVLLPEVGRFAKDEMKRCQRMQKAATIWLNHFETVGRKRIRDMPSDLAPELDAVWRRMNLTDWD